jgi:poly-gamma-glutamate capsule biosynthesis protein CapA/YwtB (metallophosphatase superfamily)
MTTMELAIHSKGKSFMRTETELIKIACLGDIMLGRGVNQLISKRSPENFWGTTLPILQSADAVIANLECAITPHQQQYNRAPKGFYFRADPAAINLLKAANIRLVSLANNHVLDFQEQGLLDTIHYLDAAGIRHAGAGRNLREATTPVILDLGVLKIGFIALTDNQPDFAATREHPGTDYLSIPADSLSLTWLENEAAQLRQAGAKLVILSAHWGHNMISRPSPQFRDFAHAVIDAGIDVFHGHSAHLFQGVEVYQKGLILYDTGDFLDDYAVAPSLRNDWSFIFLLEVTPEGSLQQLRLLPVRLYSGQANLAEGEEFTAICERMQQLCCEFKTPIQHTPEGLEVILKVPCYV